MWSDNSNGGSLIFLAWQMQARCSWVALVASCSSGARCCFWSSWWPAICWLSRWPWTPWPHMALALLFLGLLGLLSPCLSPSHGRWRRCPGFRWRVSLSSFPIKVKSKFLNWLYAAFISIFAAVLITMIAIAIQSPGTITKATVETNLVTGCTSALNIALSYG